MPSSPRLHRRGFPPYAGEVYQLKRKHRLKWKVSPIRGGSLPDAEKAQASRDSFPHLRGKFTRIIHDGRRRIQFPPYAGEVY